MSNAAVMPVPRAWISRVHVASWVVSTSVLLVAFVAPFERPVSALAVGGFTFTTVELMMLMALTLGAVAFAADPAALRLNTPISMPIAAVLLAAFLSAVAAPEFRGNSIRFWGRLMAAAALFTLTANVITTRRLAGQLIAALMAAGAIVGVLAVLELAQVSAVMDGLRLFRPGFHVVGGQVRATSTLIYPTITSMFLEVVFALGLFWLVPTRERPPSPRLPPPPRLRWTGRWTRRRTDLMAFVALALVGAGIIATFTRAGLITMALSLVIAGGLRYAAGRRWDRGHARLAALAAVLVVLVMVSRSPQMLVTRMSTEGSQDWYGATYSVPETLTLGPGSFNDVPVSLSNRGRITWQSQQAPVFALSYHFLLTGSEEIAVYDGLRTPFAQPVEPGDTVPIAARIRAPGYPGTYILVWDVVHEDRTWLSLEGVYPGRTIVTVEGSAVSPPLASQGRMPTGVMRLPRRLLWNTALAVAGDYPLIGVGPDNFRHVYGKYLGLVTWDKRVHANNTYLEVLADMGVMGAGAVSWLVVAMVLAVFRRWRETTDENSWLFGAVAAACAAIAVHGLVDSFFTFTPTYLVFALAAGLMFSPAATDRERGSSALSASSVALESSADANRI
jgi:O-antigen ligase